MLKAARTPRTRGLAARYSPAIFYRGNIASARPTAASRCRRVLTSSTGVVRPRRDSLKDTSTIDYLTAGASGVTTRGVARKKEREREGERERYRERRREHEGIPQPVIRGMHNQDSAGPKRAHTCSPAACFVSCPDDFKLRRYRRAISATATEVPAGPG